jgi:pimeloyl-ACP methyl ester carboxylesterase
MGSGQQVVVTVDGVPLSGLLADVPEPHAVVVALHGGGSDADYFDSPLDRRLSLLDVGAALGFTVISLNRPGYGSSYPYEGAMGSPDTRIELMYGALDELLAERPQGAGVFLMAHSIGCALAARMAASDRGESLLGVELSGIGLHYHSRAIELMDAWAQAEPRRDQIPTGMRDVIWGPEHLYPSDNFFVGVPPSSRIPSYEGAEAVAWPSAFPALAAAITVPVRYSLGDHECWWRPGQAGLDEVAALFTAAPRVVTDEQTWGGHNLSLGRSATAYHLKVLAFVEECILARKFATPVRSE